MEPRYWERKRMNEAETRAEHIDPALKAAAQLSPGAGYGSICP